MKKNQKNKLDKLFQQVVKERDKVCQICRKSEGLNAHHIFSRSRMNTRWDTDNGILLCPACHTFSSTLSAHKTPRAFFRWLEEKKGEDWLNKLEIRSQMIAKNLDENLIYLDLMSQLREYKINS